MSIHHAVSRDQTHDADALEDTAPRAPDSEETRDTLPSIDVGASARAPFVIELRVELAAVGDASDPTSLVVDAISESLQAHGWAPSLVSPSRSYRALRAG